MPLPSFIPAGSVLHQELKLRLAGGADVAGAAYAGVSLDELRAALDGAPSASPMAGWLITRFARPIIPVVGGSFDEPEARTWHRRLSVAGTELTRAAAAVGRIELRGHPGLDWAGSCFLVSKSAAVTTRSVAARFCRAEKGRLSMSVAGSPVKASVRFDGGVVAGVKEVVAAEAAGLGSELTFLLLDGSLGVAPVALRPVRRGASAPVAAVGYAAADSHAGSALSGLVYREGANRKCIAPGQLRGDSGASLSHDCATVDDWAGALLLDLSTGLVAGIHVAGALDRPGLGIGVASVLEAMKGLGIQAAPLPAPAPEEEDALERRQRDPEDYADREGYQKGFIGIEVPPPVAGKSIRDDVLSFEGAGGKKTTLLHYTHFSVCMSKARRMCIFTACNVHGGKLLDLPRSGIQWLFDARIGEELQAGNDLYIDNDLDRGHMVRRLDPVWGDEADAANGDTFHYTNSCPQHKDLNQKTWNDLENYVLKNAGKYELRINVFTGPVYREDDIEYRGFRVPAEFWKLVTMVKDDGKLSATAYKLSQVDLLTGLEFTYGKFRTYQVRIRDVEEWTGLDFGDLRNWDPKDVEEGVAVATPIEGPDDIRL